MGYHGRRLWWRHRFPRALPFRTASTGGVVAWTTPGRAVAPAILLMCGSVARRLPEEPGQGDRRRPDRCPCDPDGHLGADWRGCGRLPPNPTGRRLDPATAAVRDEAGLSQRQEPAIATYQPHIPHWRRRAEEAVFVTAGGEAVGEETSGHPSARRRKPRGWPWTGERVDSWDSSLSSAGVRYMHLVV